jgi:hypothetical protein
MTFPAPNQVNQLVNRHSLVLFVGLVQIILGVGDFRPARMV